MTSNYSILMQEKSGRFYCAIRELGLIASGPTPDEAYKALQEKQSAYFEEAELGGMQHVIPAPETLSLKRSLFTSNEFTQFSIKCVIAGMIISIFVGLVGFSLKNTIVAGSQQLIRDASQHAMRSTDQIVDRIQDRAISLAPTLWDKIWRELENKRYLESLAYRLDLVVNAPSPLSPEDQARLRENIRKAAITLEPYLNDINLVFRDEESGNLSCLSCTKE